MRILVLTTSYPAHPDDPSGAFVHRLALALSARGHELRVIVPGRNGLVGRRVLDGIPAWHFRYAFRDDRHALTSVPGGMPAALRRSPLTACQAPMMMAAFAAAAWAEAGRADVLWANWLGAGLIGGAVGPVHRVPMVVTLRGHDVHWMSRRPVWRRLGRRVLGRAAVVTVVSAAMVPIVEPFVPPRARPVVVPTFGVDARRFHPVTGPRAARRPGPPQGLFVGNVSRAKGVDVLLRALAQSPDAWGRFTVVGAGADMEAMRCLAVEQAVDDRVVWLGRRGVSEIPELMRQADFLVLPSLTEGRPNVVMEALASGLPVVATAVGGTPELIADGDNGLLVAAGDVAALAGALGRLAHDAELRRRLGQRARHFIEDNHLTWDRTAEEFEAVFTTAAHRGA